MISPLHTTKNLVRAEKAYLAQILIYLRETKQRKIFAQMGPIDVDLIHIFILARSL